MEKEENEENNENARGQATIRSFIIFSGGAVMNMLRWTIVYIFLGFVLLLVGSGTSAATENAPVAATKADKCPVCGMFVAKYPDFLAQIIYDDASHALFDGAKDMFKYFFNIKKYDASKDRSDIVSVYVTDYYSMDPIDGETALYVVGSDVFGPMGRELIPFRLDTDAKEFMKDHSGKKLLGFDEVTPDLIKGLK